MKRGRPKLELNRRATGFRLDASLIHQLKLEALKLGYQNPNELLEAWMREKLKKNRGK